MTKHGHNRNLMDIFTWLCAELSRNLIAWQGVSERTTDGTIYSEWRSKSLSETLQLFSDTHLENKDVLDFGCGDGQLAAHIASCKHAKSVTGVDISQEAIDRCRSIHPPEICFVKGNVNHLPFVDNQFDTILAFDCMEHVMEPVAIVKEWYRVLRTGGHCLIEWFPYKGPWGPHMESLIPIPWAHVIFGEQKMFRAAEKIYDLAEFYPRIWDLDSNGRKKPNKWRNWSSFKEQGYINQLTLGRFKEIAQSTGFRFERSCCHSFNGSAIRRHLGAALMQLPMIGEYFTSYVHIEITK
jgi:ubiquinone/menaquinone biosynthesis C-methylase UbiE